LTWNLRSDTLTPGQWLKGRIYERRCDLSPKGDLLIYFAGKYETPERTWTAISRPPYLTALALWFKGDAWGGGGLLDSDRHIRLNHRPGEEAKLAADFRLAPKTRVDLLGERPGWGEDEPIHDMRLQRDGWRRIGDWGQAKEHGFGQPYGWTFEPPLRYVRRLGPKESSIFLEMAIEAFFERQGSAYVLQYRLLDHDRELRRIGRADWADAAPNGDLLLARQGRLFRLRGGSPEALRDGDFREVADLRDHSFEERTAPAAARRW
jgi:hypothetical protein